MRLKKGILTRIRKSTFRGNNYVGNLSHIHCCDVDEMTYIGSQCSLLYTKIGKYCSIASNVKIIVGEHPSHQWVSTHPAFYTIQNPCGKSFSSERRFAVRKYADGKEEYSVSIGNDVWIGADVLIMNGVIIGDGAIIAAGAVVTQNVGAYRIVGGVPAKEIGQRFADDDIDFLQKHPFWEQKDEWIRDNAVAFDNINSYKQCFESRV